MRTKNHLRSALESGDVAFGVQVATISESMIEVCGRIGFDFVWIDLEHKGPSPYDSDTIESVVRAAELGGTNLLVRVPSGDPHVIRKVLDTGVRNIIVPQVETAEEVRRAVRATRFTYEGEPGGRGASFSRANRWGEDIDDYAGEEDRSVCLGVMIESVTAMENLDEILSVPELGFVRIGHGDMSVSLGHPIDKSHPKVGEQIDVLEEKTGEYGVPIGRGFSDVEDIKEAVADGYQLITVGRDISAVRDVLGERLEAVKDFE